MDCIECLMNERNIRESLILLKKEFDLSLYGEDDSLKQKLIGYLHHEDPKVRKNAAEILGNYEDVTKILLDSYREEEIEYVKEAYLKGIAKHPCKEYI